MTEDRKWPGLVADLIIKKEAEIREIVLCSGRPDSFVFNWELSKDIIMLLCERKRSLERPSELTLLGHLVKEVDGEKVCRFYWRRKYGYDVYFYDFDVLGEKKKIDEDRDKKFFVDMSKTLDPEKFKSDKIESIPLRDCFAINSPFGWDYCKWKFGKELHKMFPSEIVKAVTEMNYMYADAALKERAVDERELFRRSDKGDR